MDYLEIVDRIVLEAYEKGFAEIPTEAWNDVRVRNKLKIYGKENAVGQYLLNQLGESYAMQGCSKGIREQMDIEKRLQSLELRLQSFTEKKQKRLYIYTTITFILSILAFVKDYISIIAKELSKIISLILD